MNIILYLDFITPTPIEFANKIIYLAHIEKNL